jgi:hypothetical protein
LQWIRADRDTARPSLFDVLFQQVRNTVRYLSWQAAGRPEIKHVYPHRPPPKVNIVETGYFYFVKEGDFLEKCGGGAGGSEGKKCFETGFDRVV